MASVPSSSPGRALPSAAESANSTPHSPKKEVVVEDAPTNNGVFDADEIKPDLNDGLDQLDSPQCIERFRKYADEYTHRLMGKYFSGKILDGDNSFYNDGTVGDEVFKMSRAPCFQLYLNPIVGVKEQSINGLSSPGETEANTPNGKPEVKKN